MTDCHSQTTSSEAKCFCTYPISHSLRAEQDQTVLHLCAIASSLCTNIILAAAPGNTKVILLISLLNKGKTRRQNVKLLHYLSISSWSCFAISDCCLASSLFARDINAGLRFNVSVAVTFSSVPPSFWFFTLAMISWLFFGDRATAQLLTWGETRQRSYNKFWTDNTFITLDKTARALSTQFSFITYKRKHRWHGNTQIMHNTLTVAG